jgi:hypothetical protein
MSIERDLLERINAFVLDKHLTISDVAYFFEMETKINETFLEVRELLAQPEQEPVAWMYEWVNEIGEPVKSVVYNFYEDVNLIPLYTAPQTREPLSDKECMALGVKNVD